MSEYKRLTERHENGYIELMCNFCKYNDKCDVETHYCNEAVKNCLAELEDKIENIMLIELPCKVGQQVYVDRDTWGYKDITNFICIKNKVFYYGEIVNFVITKNQFLMKIGVYKTAGRLCYKTKRYPISAKGKTIFLSKEAAETRLKELQEKNK